MRYWAYLAGKLVVAAAPLYGLLLWMGRHFPASKDPYAPLGIGIQFLLCDLALLVWFLLCVGAFYAIVWDQRRRCRVCLARVLRNTGWNSADCGASRTGSIVFRA